MVTAMNARAMRTSAILGALLCASAGGCGPGSGDGDPPRCLQVQPCGGDVVGTWKLLGACTSPAFLSELNAQVQASCSGASVTALDVDLSGTFTYNPDLTYSMTGTETISGTEMIPLSCLGYASCAAAQPASADATLTCTGTTICTCHIGASSAAPETGTYTIVGTTLTTIGPVSTTTDAYCVENGRLHLMEMSRTSGAILGDFVGQKQ
jgi:hypothetical protein